MTNTRAKESGDTPSALSRRDVLLGLGTAAALAPIVAGARPAQGEVPRTKPAEESPAPRGTEPSATEPRPAERAQGYLPVRVPNGATLPFKRVGGVKVFHLIAEEVAHTFAPGLAAKCWGYNGRVHGPLIEAVEGDRLRIYVTNKLPAATTVHWHGILVPSGMDGVGGLTQPSIAPGETFRYEFTARQSGTGMYHSHHDEMTQMALGLTGMFVIHPRAPRGPRVQRDYAIMLHEWRIDPGAARPNPNEMTEFNVLTMNGKVFPATAPLLAQKGERVRIRFGNLSATDHHPIHLHGFQFKITETDGGRIAEAAQWPETTVLVPVGSTRTIELVADAPGDWALHCHMTHHVMNQMGHGVPNMIGVRPGAGDAELQKLVPEYMPMGREGMSDMGGMAVPANTIPMQGGQGKYGGITMGGMFTVLKVRERLAGDADPGWYAPPAGTLARVATAEELARDEVEVG